MADTRAIGERGEDAAARYLRRRGYRILRRNVRLKRDEIDIIAFDRLRRMLVFVEVKTRMRDDERYPIWTAVDSRKRRCLQRAAAAWCLQEHYEGPARVDIMCVHQEQVTQHILNIGATLFCE